MPSAFETLSSVPLFVNLSARQQRRVARNTTESRYEAGDVIVREGGHTETLFVILEGAARVIRKGRTIARLGAGEFFGEISLIDGRPRGRNRCGRFAGALLGPGARWFAEAPAG
jgi:CRP/FNR family cyclic AMP-dependent transcriptional regulator